MARPKGKNVIRKHFKLTEETARILAERSKAENMNESEYIRYLLLNQSEQPRSRELELEHKIPDFLYTGSKNVEFTLFLPFLCITIQLYT